jgi:hypothetical protein
MFQRIIKGKNKGKYISENGKVFTEKQVNLYRETKFDPRKLAERLLLKGMRGDKS